MNNLFSGVEVVSAYTRAQALRDGGLIDVTEMAREAGFRFPVALTAAVWGDCVAWDGKGEAVHQDEPGRLCDVLTMAGLAAHNQRGDRAPFLVYRVSRGKQHPEPVRLVAHIGPGDAGEPVVTIMQPGED
jgi:hypothetical protein